MLSGSTLHQILLSGACVPEPHSARRAVGLAFSSHPGSFMRPPEKGIALSIEQAGRENPCASFDNLALPAHAAGRSTLASDSLPRWANTGSGPCRSYSRIPAAWQPTGQSQPDTERKGRDVPGYARHARVSCAMWAQEECDRTSVPIPHISVRRESIPACPYRGSAGLYKDQGPAEAPESRHAGISILPCAHRRRKPEPISDTGEPLWFRAVRCTLPDCRPSLLSSRRSERDAVL